eukprot:1319357-Pyramimonas_sp.AAC.1
MSAQRASPRHEVPPRCVSGRWSSVNAVEEMCGDAGRGLSCPVLIMVIGKKRSNRAAAEQKSSAVICRYELTGLAVEDSKIYQASVSKWRADLLQLCDPTETLFWRVLSSARRVHAPCDHFFRFTLEHQTRDSGHRRA